MLHLVIKRILACIVGYGLAGVPVAWADTTLALAFERAWARQPEAQSLPAEEAAATAFSEWAAGWTPGAPALSLGHVSDRFNWNHGKREWEIELGVPLWLPGERGARVREGEAAAAELAARRAALRLQVAGEVREAWWAVAEARVVRSRAVAREDAAVRLRDEVERRVRAGDLARLDLNQASAEVFDAAAERADAEQRVVAVEQAWKILTGETVPATLAPESVVQETVSAMPTDLVDHPQWRAAQAAGQLAATRLAAVRAKTREAPELAVRWIRDRGDFADPWGDTIGVQVKIPLSSGPQYRRETAEASAQMASREAELVRTEQIVRSGLERARQALLRTARQFAAAKTQRDLAAESRALADKAFALGEIDLAALLRLTNAARAAELRFEQLTIARLAAQSQLKQALGELP